MDKDRLLRIRQIIPHYLPISKASFWAGIKKGIYPRGFHLTERTRVWRESEILEIVQRGEHNE